MKLFSYKNRPVSKGPFPLELLTRQSQLPDLKEIPSLLLLSFHDSGNRVGMVKKETGTIPSDL